MIHTSGAGGRTLRLSLVEQVSMRESKLFQSVMRVSKVSRVPGCKAPAKRRARSRSVQLQNSSIYWILEACHIDRRGALVRGSFSCRRSCQCDLSWRAPSSWKWYASWLIGFGSAPVVAWYSSCCLRFQRYRVWALSLEHRARMPRYADILTRFAACVETA